MSSVALAGEQREWEPTLVWHAPPGCPDEAWFVEELRGEVGGFIGIANDPPWRVWVGIAQSPDGAWTAAVRTTRGDDEGQRDVGSGTCESVARGAALVVALAMEEARLPPPAPTSVPSPVVPAPEPTPVPASNEAGGRWWFGVAGEVSGGPMPAAASGLHIRVSRETESLAVGLRLRTLPQGAVELTGTAGEVRLWMLAAGPEACLHGMAGSFQLGGCGYAEVGVLGGEGSEVDAATSGGRTWLSLGAEGRVGWRITRATRLEAALGLGAVPWRPDVVLDPGLSLHRPGFLELRGSLGLSIAFFGNGSGIP